MKKKLILKKQTIVNLNNTTMNKIKGGATEASCIGTCVTCEPTCASCEPGGETCDVTCDCSVVVKCESIPHC